MIRLLTLFAAMLCGICGSNGSVHAGLVFVEFKDGSYPGFFGGSGIEATGVVNTIANTFTIQTYNAGTSFTLTPQEPLVLFGIDGNISPTTPWDVPDNATLDDIVAALNADARMFLLPNSVSSYLWNGPTDAANFTGWGGGVLDFGPENGGPLLEDRSANQFHKWPDIGTGADTVTFGTVAAVVAVPEPSSFALLVLASIGGIGWRFRRWVNGLFVFSAVLMIAGQAQAGFIMVEMTSSSGPQKVTGTIDTVANTFSIETFIPPTTPANIGVPTTFPLVLQAYQRVTSSTFTTWDVPDAATFADVKAALDIGPQFFAVAGTNLDYTWANGATGTQFAKGGWGGGVFDPNNVLGSRLVADSTSATFFRWAQGATTSGGSFNFTNVQEVLAVPEPTSILFATVAAGLGITSYIRKRKRQPPCVT